MTTISANQVKELRERTGAGMMECKNALKISDGDMGKAIEALRKSGSAKADKKAGRIAAQGVIVIGDKNNQAVMIEVNSETDFVARDASFLAFVDALMQTALQHPQADIETLSTQLLEGHAPHTVEAARQELVSKIGENVQIRRIERSKSTSASVGTYLHSGRIGVIVELDIDHKELARDIAMHIAASKPLVIAPEHVSPDIIAKEKEIYIAQAATSGKPQDIIEKMVAGRLKKYLDEVSLLGQPFVKDPDVTVGAMLGKHRAKVLAFYRYEVGEGIEKTSEDFKEAVMMQIQGN